MRRLGVLEIFSPDGYVEDYIVYLLKEIRKVVSDIVVVSNGFLDKDSKSKIAILADEIYERQDEGFDCGAFRDVFINYLGWEKVQKYDELIFLNDSCFGPIFSIDDLFDEMNKQNVDFWGITEQQPIKKSLTTNEYYPYHIQIYFTVIRSRMLKSIDFIRFWEELDVPRNYREAVENYELRFAQYFHERGYKSSVYVDSECFSLSKEDNLPYIIFDSYKLLSRSKCPFIKKKVFTCSHEVVLSTSLGENAKRSMDFITNQTDYGENLIWNYLLRNIDTLNIKNSLHLEYVISDNAYINKKINRKINKKIAVIAHVSYSDLINQCWEYIDQIDDAIDIFITTKGKENIDRIDALIKEKDKTNIRLIVPEDRGREISALLVACKNYLMEYDYLCFVHDKKKNAGIPYATVGQSFMDILWENSIKNDMYISNVIDTFEKEPKLGLLSPPCPYMSYFFMMSGLSWTSCYDKTVELSKKLELTCKMSEDKPPFALGTTFWCRPKALKSLFEANWEYSDFEPEPMPADNTISHAIERIFAYVAQSEGYYSGIMMNQTYASLYVNNYTYMMNGIIKKVLQDYGIHQYSDIKRINPDIFDFCTRKGNVYIYGAGAYGRNCFRYMREHNIDISGFVVSDGHKKENTLASKEIYEISEVENEDNIGFIIALSRDNTQYAISSLKQHHITDYLFFYPDEM